MGDTVLPGPVEMVPRETSARMITFVDLQSQYREVKSEIDRVIASILERGAYIGGREVEDFERWFADYCGVTHALGVSSGTTALELALRAVGVGPGDEVVTVSHTFIASVAAITATGAAPVLIDIDPNTGNMDPGKLAAAMTPKTKAVLPVHLYGHPAELDAITAIAASHGVPVIEDAAQAHGARYRGRRVGSLGTVACFSFYPTKNLGAFGDGGLITTSDDEIAKQVRLLRDHGRISKYEHAIVGQTARLDTIQAGVLRVQADRLDAWNARRRQVASWYRHHLAHTPLTLPVESADAEPVYHLYAVRTPRRDALRDHLTSRQIGVGIHYPIPVHLQPAYRHLRYSQGSLPVSEQFASEQLSLPMHPFLDEAAVVHVAHAITEFFS
jgi:dTDP-4-amino-4,6-dideoxygalactose transaminase